MPENPRNFQAESYQVGNILRALRESSDGDLVLKDKFFPSGIRLRDFLTSQGVAGEVDTIVAPISAYLQGQIELNDIDIDVLYSITSALSAAIDSSDVIAENVDVDNSSFTSPMSAASNVQEALESIDDVLAGGTNDGDYVSVDGDTMTGDLSITTLSGAEESLKVDITGKIEKTGYAPLVGGQLMLNTVDSTYSITNSNITLTSNPVCSIIAPISGATIFGHSVNNIQNGSFNVELSEAPGLSGYYLNWMSLQYI